MPRRLGGHVGSAAILWCAAAAIARHGRGPTHAERARHRRSRPVPGRPRHRSTQPGGHPPQRGHLDGGLGERTNTARRGATEPALGPHQHRRTLIAQPVSHPLGPILLDPRAEGPTARTRRIGARHAHRHLQPAAALDRAGHLEVLQPGQRTRNITHLGASFSGQLSLPDSRGPDPRPRTLRSHHQYECVEPVNAGSRDIRECSAAGRTPDASLDLGSQLLISILLAREWSAPVLRIPQGQ